jgi:hypothetical protein
MNATKKKLTLSIEPSLNRRIDIEAAVRGKGHDRSSIVEGLINRHICLPEDWREFPDSDAQTPRATEGKASPRQREKTTFYVSTMAARLLGLHAQLTETDRSSIVERLVTEYITPWDVYDPRECHLTARRKGRQSEAAEINPPALAMAS